MATGRLLRGRERRYSARSHPTGQDRGELVAGDPDRPHPRRQQRRTEGFNRVIKQIKRVGCGSDHKSTIGAVSSATSRSPDRKDQQHERVTSQGSNSKSR
jgi:hypothetical protein